MQRMGRGRGNRESEDLPGENKFNVFGEKKENMSARSISAGLLLFSSTCFNNMSRFVILLFSIFFVSLAHAQSDTITWMKPVDIRAERFHFTDPGMQVHALDTSKISKLTGYTLADRLGRESMLFMKSYGPGSLSTLSLRGTGAAHTAVLWNGLSLNSPMNGIYDFSLLPVFLLDEVSIQSGGNGPLAGGGAVGGAIYMNSGTEFTKGVSGEVMTGYGSFGQQQYGAGIVVANGQLVTKTKIYTQRAENNFSFTTPEGQSKIQSHARFRQLGITEDIRFGRKDNHLDLHLWYLENEREIPPHMLAQLSLQEQQDKSLRAVAEWAVSHDKWFWNINGGINREEIKYTDPEARLDELSTATTVQATAELGHHFSKNFKLISQFATIHALANCEGYATQQQQEQWSLGLKGVFENHKWYINASIRQGLFDEEMIPFLPAVNLRYNFVPTLSWKADVARVFRVPTLNDRYWIAGGNKNLEPEQGFSSSTGIQWLLKKEKFSMKMQANVFFSELEKAIVWLPGLNGIYAAENIHEMESKGFEGEVDLAYTTGKWKFRARLTTPVVSSKITKSDPSFDSGIGKQMIYTPRLMYKSEAEITFHTFSIRYYHNYTGYRYTTIDHAHYLDPFDCAELILAWTGTLGKGSLTLTGGIKNLYEENYQVIAWRAMPGRSFHGGLLFTFGK